MYVLPDNLRDKLKEPLGDLVDTRKLLDIVSGKNFIVSVGDFVTFTLIENGINPDISIVDYIVKRKNYSDEMKDKIGSFDAKVVNVKNPAGTISDELWNAIEFAFEHRGECCFRIEVDGEEDLAALAVIYKAPSDATIIYGMPNKGAVVVEATNENKQKVKDILNRM